MKGKFFMVLVVSLLVLGLTYPTVTFGALYDNFQKKTINPAKWGNYELVREIRDGKLYSKVTAYGTRVANNLNFKDPNSINYIEADVTVYEIKDQFDKTNENIYTHPNACLTGFFYNDGTASGPGSYKGEVQASLWIRKFRGLATIGWKIFKITNENGTSWISLAQADFPIKFSLKKTYKLSILFEPDQKRFTFTVDGTSLTWISTDENINTPNIPWKAIRTDVGFTSNAENFSGSITATFDNVIAKDNYGNIIVNDDFSSPMIDPQNWSSFEIVRETSGGKLWSELRSENQNIGNILSFKNPETINDFQAKVTLHEFQNPNGSNARARLGAYFYNDSGGSSSIGDVWAEVSIGGRGENPIAYWSVSRKNDEAGNSWTTLSYGTFPINVQLGEVYTLFLGWDSTKIIMKCNEFVETYTPTNSIYPPFDKTKGLTTRISPPSSPSLYSAFISATFDDVVVNELAQPVDGEWVLDISGKDKGGAVIKFMGYKFEGYGFTLGLRRPFLITGNYDINIKGMITGNITLKEYDSGDIIGTSNFTGKIDKNRTKLSLKILEGPITTNGVRMPDDPEIPEDWTVKISGGVKGTIDPFTIQSYEEDNQIIKRVYTISGEGEVEEHGEILTFQIEGYFILTQKNMAYGFYEVFGDGIDYDSGIFSGKITLPSGKFNFRGESEEGFKFSLLGTKKN